MKITVTPSSWLEPSADIAYRGPARITTYMAGAVVSALDFRTVLSACDYCNKKAWRYVRKATPNFYVEITAPGLSQTLNVDPASLEAAKIRI